MLYLKSKNPFSLRLIVLLVLISVITVSGCKKKRAFNEEDAQDTVDIRIMQAECDEIFKDVNTVILEQPSLRSQDPAAGSSTTSVCGATIDTSAMGQGIFVINYNGSDCFGRVRTGSVRCTMQGFPGVRWKHQGCVVKVELQNYRLSRKSDGKGFLMEGTLTFTNESGNTLYEQWFMNQPKLVQRMQGEGMRSAYDNGDLVKMTIDRRITIGSSNYVISFSCEGLGSADGHTNLENWGQARKGASFTTEVTYPYTWKTSCGSIAPVYGQYIVRFSDRDHEIKCDLAVDKDGNPMEWSDNPCPFGWRASWTFKKKSKQTMLNYY